MIGKMRRSGEIGSAARRKPHRADVVGVGRINTRERQSPELEGSLKAAQFYFAAVPTPPPQCASSQLSAACASTASGTESETAGCGASSITVLITGSVVST